MVNSILPIYWTLVDAAEQTSRIGRGIRNLPAETNGFIKVLSALGTRSIE